jgi:hypothetical protein
MVFQLTIVASNHIAGKKLHGYIVGYVRYFLPLLDIDV